MHAQEPAALRAAARQQLACIYDEQRQNLMHRAFTGNRSVHVAP